MALLSNRRVVLGVAGGIAAYKTPELVRRLRDAGADVVVVMTAAATRFVTPLTLEVVSGHPVGVSLWDTTRDGQGGAAIHHTELVRDADLCIVAPATADLIGKIRHGLADDLLTTAIMAAKTPVLLCPSMNTEMLDNPIVAANLSDLLAMPRYHQVPPDAGLLACGVTGAGRLPDPPAIIEAAAAILSSKPLLGRRILVSAGPTRERIDPVRYIENQSTGTMGFELARALAQLGAEVTLVAGPVARATPAAVARRIDCESAADMLAAVLAEWPALDALVMAAAVADWTPASPSGQKLKKGDGADPPSLPLAPTVDILRHLASLPDARRVVRIGFAAETQDVLAYARRKLGDKDLDAIVANDVSAPGVGFGPHDNAGHLLTRSGDTIALPRRPKEAFADDLAARLAALWPSLSPRSAP
jgi:phosphopantothenoylcysteine decarboxylase/phosphopantothenate--cysteine ligase